MLVRPGLVYFGFPKCGSTWMRAELRLQWGSAFDPRDWDKCPAFFVHVQPRRFLQAHALDLTGTRAGAGSGVGAGAGARAGAGAGAVASVGAVAAFTIVRNPFARLLSCWKWATTDASLVNRMAAQDAGGNALSFEAFVTRIFHHRDNLRALPLCWMYLPFEQYFEGVDLEALRTFKLERANDVVAWLGSQGIRIRNKVMCRTVHGHYSEYYTPEMRAMVEEVYAFELARFGYSFAE